MYPLTHFLVPFLVGQVLIKYGYLDYKLALLAGILGVLIDIDHYLHRIWSARDWNFRTAWNLAVTHHDRGERTFLHHFKGLVVVSLLIIMITWFSWEIAVMIALAYYSHFLIDHLNFHVHRKLKLKEGGYVFLVPFYEVIFDIVLVLFSWVLFSGVLSLS